MSWNFAFSMRRRKFGKRRVRKPTILMLNFASALSSDKGRRNTLLIFPRVDRSQAGRRGAGTAASRQGSRHTA